MKSALAEAVEHLVEGAREPAQLVRRANGQRLRQVTARHARHPRGQGADRPCQAPGEEQAQDQRADRPDRRGVHERGPQLMEPVEVDLDRVVDLDHGGHATARIQDGRERGDPPAARIGVDARIARHPVLERPPEGIDQLGGQRIGLARAPGPLALHDELRAPGGGVEVAERLDGRGEQDFVLDGHQALLEFPVGGRARVEGPLRLGVKAGSMRRAATRAMLRSWVPTVSCTSRCCRW